MGGEETTRKESNEGILTSQDYSRSTLICCHYSILKRSVTNKSECSLIEIPQSRSRISFARSASTLSRAFVPFAPYVYSQSNHQLAEKTTLPRGSLNLKFFGLIKKNFSTSMTSLARPPAAPHTLSLSDSTSSELLNGQGAKGGKGKMDYNALAGSKPLTLSSLLENPVEFTRAKLQSREDEIPYKPINRKVSFSKSFSSCFLIQLF